MIPRRALILAVLSSLACSAADASTSDADTSTSSDTGTTSTAGSADTGTTDGTGGADATGSSGSTGGDTGSGTTGAAGCGTTIYVNFDGVTLTAGMDDAPNDMTQNSEMATELLPYSGPADTAEVMAIMAEHWAPFDVCVTDERPDSGPYTMIVVTPTNPYGMGITGIAPLDCEDTNKNSVTFTMPPDSYVARQLANANSSNVGPTFGEENQGVDNEDLMCRAGESCEDDSDRTFKDTCIELLTPANCGSQHEAHCPAMQQNSFRSLLDVLGPAG